MIAAIIVVSDQLTKMWVVSNLTVDQPNRILGGVIYLTLYRNGSELLSAGTAFTWVLASFVVAVVIVIVRMAGKLRSTDWAIAFGAILGGTVGNLIDRMFRTPGFMRGHVVDFISLFEPYGQHFALFNVADIGILLGFLALIGTAMRGVDMDGRRHHGRKRVRKTS